MYQGKFERGYKDARKHMPPLAAPVKAKRKGPRLGSAVFYIVFFSCILVFCLALYGVLTYFRGWLTDYELAQPTRKSQEVFAQLFEARDWNALYDAAQVQGESRESFVSYMETAVGSQALTCMETSTGLSDDRKYIVRLENRKLASFTLTDKNESETRTELPDWQLSGVEFFFDRQDTWLVQVPDGCTVYVDGEALGESSILRIRSTKADSYLPEGVTGPRTVTMQVTGKVTKPDVDVLDRSGKELTVVFDDTDRTFTAETDSPSISDEERQAALDAVKTYALFMIERAGADEVARYFERGTDTYTAIIKTDRSAVQDAQSREFVNESVTDYCRYSDGSFSVRVEVTLNRYRPSGSVKENHIAQSLFFRKQEGSWKCWQMTAVDVSAEVEQVRLVFRDGAEVLSDNFYETDLARLTCPAVTAPEGKVFSGWAVQESNPEGQTVMRLMFQPDETGTVPLPGDGSLGPMVLYPLFA